MIEQIYIEIIPLIGATRYFALDRESVIVGRASDRSDLVLDDPRASRIHLQIARSPEGHWLVSDLDTANGTTLDDVALSPEVSRVWQFSQVVIVGDTKLILRQGEVPAADATQEYVTKPTGNLETQMVRPGMRTTQAAQVVPSPKTKAMARLANTVGMVLVLALSLLLLAYVGLGEANRTYPTFELDKLAAQGEIVRNSMESTLLAGLPLEQVPGFKSLTDPLLSSDPTIVSIYVTGADGQTVFANGETDAITAEADFQASVLKASCLQNQDADSRCQISENASYYQVSLDLKSKFETLGKLHVTLPKSVIAERIGASFIYVALAAGVVLLLFAVGLEVDLFVAARRGTASARWLTLSYGMAFFAMAVIVILTLVNVYSAGIQAKTQALANALGQRLTIPLQLGLDINDFADLQQVFEDYKKLDPDLGFVALTEDNTVRIDTDKTRLSANWQAPSDHILYSFPLQRSGDSLALQTALQIGVPNSVIYSKLWTSVKNFFVLFVASGFLSLLFFNLMWAFIHRPVVDDHATKEQLLAVSNFQLSLIRPLYFLTVFAEGLASSFLPQYLKGLATDQGVDPSIVSTLFTTYFLAFVLTLIPAGQFAERRGVKPLLIGGSLLISASLVLMALVPNVYAMFAFRIISGIGGGMLLIGVQSYILDVATAGQKTQGAAIVVFGYNGGMISGAAIGALLAVYMGKQGVFVVGAVTGFLALVYSSGLIPNVSKVEQVHEEAPSTLKRGFMSSIRDAAKDLEFMKAMLFIGIPAKAILTGVTIFALPLLLARQDYAQEDIGQIIMLYAAGVLLSSAYVSRLVDRMGKTTGILFIGTIGSGIGLVLIGLAGVEVLSHEWKTIVLIVGMTMLGLAHGFIHAPIVTHVSETNAANTLGKSSATSLYRLLERIGHVSGPLIVGQLLLFSHESLLAISWLGVITILLGILFLVRLGFGSPKDATASASAS